jgi:glycosyl-4,4'-diaponeurosporenoate acyltransferase
VIRLVLIDSAAWALWCVVVGFGAGFLPTRVLERDTWLTRPRAFERDGRCYERWRIRRWKDRLPEAGAIFGGVSKRRLPDDGRAGIDRFVVETRRAELVHWAILALTPWFVLWNPWPLALAMVVYGLVANVPCLVVQRYNRARIGRIVARRRRMVAR